MPYTTTNEVFDRPTVYPTEFNELLLSQEQEAKAEFNQVEALQLEIKMEA